MEMLILRQARGAPTPELEDWPDLPEELEIFWDGFCQLSSRRLSTGFGVSGIPITEMVAWLDANQIDDEYDRSLFMRYFIALDRVYLEHAAAEAEKSNRKK